MSSYHAIITILGPAGGGGHPDNELPSPQPPRPPTIWPTPPRPVDPGYGQGRPMPPVVGGGPVYPPEIWPTPPGGGGEPPRPWEPAFPDNTLPGGGGGIPPGGWTKPVRPEIDNSLPAPPPPQAPPGWVVVWVPGVGWAAVKVDAKPDNTLPTPPTGEAPPTVDNTLPPHAQPKTDPYAK